MSPALTQALARLVDYLAIHDDPAPADAIFLFGNYMLAIPDMGARLYHARYAQTILASGYSGHNPQFNLWDAPIAQVYKERLLAHKVPAEAILTIMQATNTLQDVQSGMPYLLGAVPHLQRLLIVTRATHQRRAWATLQKHYPQFTYLNVPVAEDLATTAQEKEVAARAVGEIERLQRYADKGDIVYQEIPEDVLDMYQTLREWIRDDVY